MRLSPRLGPCAALGHLRLEEVEPMRLKRDRETRRRPRRRSEKALDIWVAKAHHRPHHALWRSRVSSRRRGARTRDHVDDHILLEDLEQFPVYRRRRTNPWIRRRAPSAS